MISTDLKVIVEQWLESPQPQQHFVAPNQLLDLREEGALILQVAPIAPGRSRIRRFDFAARSAWRRRSSAWLRQQIELAESTQAGLAGAVEESAEAGPVAPALTQFRESIAALLHTLPAA